MSSNASKGGKWTNTLVFINYNKNGEPVKTVFNEEQVLWEFRQLKTNEEKILKATIWKHPLKRSPGLFGDWHEYTVAESTNCFWSFEKQTDDVYVQRSKDEANVKSKLYGKKRSARIGLEGRSNNSVKHEESIYNVIEWIVNNKELNNTYNFTQSNCHYFASELYEAIVRDCEKRLDDKDAKSKKNENDRLRVLRPTLRALSKWFFDD